MRPVFIAIILATGTLQVTAWQERQFPGPLYRGPVYSTRPARAIEAARGMPVELSSGSYTSGGLRNPATINTSIKSRALRPIPVSGITLRAAFGPLPDGIVTFRLRPELQTEPEPWGRILPGGVAPLLRFVIVDEDPGPGIISMLSTMQIVYTVERIESEEGPPIFENPDATELLWDALGRPTLSQR